ncbi:reprolysin-like metallopeptidase [Horticoccus sp. 23ND18S-11]|uniref:reprolysin-like metallopeptidase n=1 Tax=Horticoccus sp. 23ND18S-11 TaxID=3391832 RepID=UPI0039C9394E
MTTCSQTSRRRWLSRLLLAVAVVTFLAGLVRKQETRPTTSADRPVPDVRVNSVPAAPVARSGAATEGEPSGNTTPLLFHYVQPADAADLDQALPAPSQKIHYVRLNTAALSGKASPFWQPPGAGRVTVPLPDGSTFTLVIEGSEMLGPDRFLSLGRIGDRPASRVLLTWNAGFLHAEIRDPVLGTFALRAATAELAQFYRIDPGLVPPCGGERRPRFAALPRASAGATSGNAAAIPAAMAAPDNPQRAEVHVLMLHTPAVLSTLSGVSRTAALQSAFDLAIAKVNDVFAASLISARVKLVGVAETPYDESRSGPSRVQDDALTAVYLTDDGAMDEIHAIRDRVGADIVCLALQRTDTASSGLSFLLDRPSDTTNPLYAFSIIQYTAIAGTTVVPHEFGHVMGCAHDRENAFSGEGAFSFSYGYRFIGADNIQYHDIMSYPPGVELAYFSNPDVVAPAPINVPLGIPAGRPGESNSALTIERTAFITSTYRLQTLAAADAGSLINVATRARVGTGNEVLIGGFVVQGTRPARMLIRAAGPALAAFGVTDALADPQLRIFAEGRVAAENDHWGTPLGTGDPASAAEIAAAAAQARAFPFAAGSADAAVLVTLPPGAYSAVVEGARGTTGSGLVEAYEIARDGAQIVNLATRGFAGRDGRELVGGFVVEGVPGTTKRLLIRVLGPTLGRAPFLLDGVMDDPEFELRNAAGELLLTGDDWSSDAIGGINRVNDFQPIVASYGEKQIFATGLAPTNRREPCVLVDLPPGSFTVIVRPYELRSSIPGRDQPAVPGVGVVEVYEIRR